MSRIKNKDTKPELLVRRFLHSHGFRYKLHDKSLPGRPDMVLPKYKTVIFVHGCFWHGHEGCRYFVLPKTKANWWLDKINRNIQKDRDVIEYFRKTDWQVILIWECELKPKVREATMSKVVSLLRNH